MGIHLHHPSLSIAFLFSLSLAGAAVSADTKPSLRHFLRQFKPKPTATASDLISLLGTPQQASSINVYEAQQLQSCFKFIVPFSPTRPGLAPSRRALTDCRNRNIGCGKREEENELVWWPPLAVMELARIAVDSGGDTAAIQRTLDPTIIPVPDIEGSNENRCELTRTPYGRHFISEDLNSYLEFLFKLIAVRGPDVGLNVSLNRYDFFHGHIFLASDSGRLGIFLGTTATRFVPTPASFLPKALGLPKVLHEVQHERSSLTSSPSLQFIDAFVVPEFCERQQIMTIICVLPKKFHAKEYPAFDKETFPYNMGYCQIGSNVKYDESMNLRNILWLAPLPDTTTKAWLAPGVLVVLDARPDGIIYKDLIPGYAHYVRTLYEEDFGDIVADVNYLNSGGTKHEYKIFIC